MRLYAYAGASTAAAAACLLKAFHQRPNFYSATVYLAQSNACLLILTNLALVLACSFMYGLQRLLYGRLRPIEIEQLSEKAWYAVLDTLLAMPSFREDVGGWLLTMFVLLLAGKVWGWIGEGRVDILEQQPPANPRLFHARLATSLIASVVFDLLMLDFCLDTVMADPRPGMMVIFTFEFAILTIFSLFTLSRYCLVVWESVVQKQQVKEAIEMRKTEIRAERIAARQQETADGSPTPAITPDEEPIEVDENEVDVPGWEEKRRYLFALELVSDFVKLVIYIFFFAVSITFNGLPMHIMRDVYMTFASFSKRVADYMAYRKATSDMNTKYSDATTEEIRGDACIVCRENMIAWEQPAAQPPADGQPPTPATRRDEGLRAKKLPCGHILHLRCLKAWLERQQVCPTCRRPVVTAATEAAVAAAGGHAGANPAAPGQQGQEQNPRRNRARIFNLGPVRIGFLHGQGDQIQNIVNQMRNPAVPQNQIVAPGTGPQQQGQPALQQQSPNQFGALGLGQQRAAGPGQWTNIPTQIQLMNVEQRIMQDAYNLDIEQQQLATLRMMETELARLRGRQLPAQAPVGTPSVAQRMAMLQAQRQPRPGPETLRGSADQEVQPGQGGYPEGLVLPEGWTILPLQRADNAVDPEAALRAQYLAAGAQARNPALTPTIPPSAPNGAAQSPYALPPQQTQAENGPTDDNGSPLFVPITPASATTKNSDPNSAPSAPPAPTQSTPTMTTNGSASPPPTSTTEAPAPWTDDESWSFNGASAANTHENGKPANGHVTEPGGSNHEGKGKGKAAEVEEASDAEG